MFVIQNFLTLHDFFAVPFQSSQIGIYKVADLNPSYSTCNFHDIKRKCVLLSLNDQLAVFPLRHALND